ncbi:MAG: phosphatase PAP2 family protein, partial [Caldimonas sp.]
TADRGAAFWAHRTSGPFVHGIAHGISIIHSPLGILTLTAIVAVVLVGLAQTRWIPTLVAVIPGGLLLNTAIKHDVQRPRPDWGFGATSLGSYSFPSGHTAGSAFFYGVLVVVLWRHVKAPWGRGALLLVAGVLVVLVASSRIILGVHFLSDCIAAVLEALAWISICLFVGPRDPAWNARTP